MRVNSKMKFIKMHGLGNDFIVIDQLEQTFKIHQNTIKSFCDRRRGIGCDQVLLILPSNSEDAQMRIFNSDGTEAEACGNGARCVVRYLAEKLNKKEIKIESSNRVLFGNLTSNKLVSLNMGKANFSWENIPLSKRMDTLNLNLDFKDSLGNIIHSPVCVNVGNPHVVFFVEDLNLINLRELGPEIENHSFFPEKVNANIASIVNRSLIHLKVWERGAGLTKACGTGACATAVAAIQKNFCDNEVDVSLPGGILKIQLNGKMDIIMTGSAEYSFSGEIHFD